MNFSPQPFLERDSRLVLLWLLNLVALAVLIFGLTQWYSLRQQNARVHASLADLREEQSLLVEKNELIIERLEELDVRTYQKDMARFRVIGNSFRTRWGHLLDELGTLLPADVRIEALRSNTDRKRNQSRRTFNLEGAARNKQAQLAFIEALQGHPAFGDVKFTSEDYQRQGNVAVGFAIQFTYPQGGQ
jgi:Tfp pilus assembly protein PilN